MDVFIVVVLSVQLAVNVIVIVADSWSIIKDDVIVISVPIIAC